MNSCFYLKIIEFNNNDNNKGRLLHARQSLFFNSIEVMQHTKVLAVVEQQTSATQTGAYLSLLGS